MEWKLRSTPKTVSVSSAYVCDYDYPGISLVRAKLAKLIFWNQWKERFRERTIENCNEIARIHAKCLLTLIKNSQKIITQRKYFDRWKRSTTNHTPSPPLSPKYHEFMSELQETVGSIAHYETTVDVLDSKINEMRALYETTRRKTDSLKSDLSQASDKYDELLKLIAQKKIEHRDLVAKLQLNLGTLKNARKPPVSGSVHDPEIKARLSREHASYCESMDNLKRQFDLTRQKALELRAQIDVVREKNDHLDREIADLAKEREEIGNVEENFLLSKQRGETLKLMKLLKAADEQLQESAETIETQNRQLRELDLQIRTKKQILTEIKS